MAVKPSYASTFPWFWLIEALATFKEVDTSILVDVVKWTPEISDDLGKNAKEMVSLRILESFVAQQIGSTKGFSSAPDSNIALNPSEHCEDVVQNILHESSASNLRMDEPEMLKWDIRTFTKHKRDCLPKCILQQLKDAILVGNHPILASFKESSGLPSSNLSENRILVDDSDSDVVAGRLERSSSKSQNMAAEGKLTSPSPENQDGFLQEDSPNKNLTSKRARSDLDTGNLAAKSHEDQITMDNGWDPPWQNIKKLKQDGTIIQDVGQKSVPISGIELSKDFSGRDGQLTLIEGFDLAKASQVGGLEENSCSEDGHDQDIASKRPGQGNDADDAELQHNHPQLSCKDCTMPQDTYGDRPHRDHFVHEANDEGVCCAEITTSQAAPPDGNHQNISGKESRDTLEKSALNTSYGAPQDGSYGKNFPYEAIVDMEHNHGPEICSDREGYPIEKINVAMHKCTFLSSQCTFSQDPLATADCTELELCMKCNKGGHLLVCSASTCPLVVQQSCFGSALSFDESGNFYCPFCSYSCAISEYLEVKKKSSLARKDLAAFIGLENGHRVKKLSERFFTSEKNLFRQHDDVIGNNEANYYGKYGNEVVCSQYRSNIEDKQRAEPSASCLIGNLPCGEEGAPVHDETCSVLIERNKAGENIGTEC